MAARAIWKAVIVAGGVKLPVKLYSAVQEHTIHFRLLHKTDLAPVQQKMIDSESGEAVSSKDIHKASPVGRNRLVKLEDDELEAIAPKDSRAIEITRFVDPDAIDHRWYERAYWLGPDGDSAAYFAAAEALRKKGKEGVAKWVMRKKHYIGALREDGGYLVLITLRYAEEVIDASALPAPQGRPLQSKEIAMGEQLVKTLAGKFDPAAFRDEYRDRVMDLINTKAKGRKPKLTTFKPKKTSDDALTAALQASLSGRKKVA